MPESTIAECLLTKSDKLNAELLKTVLQFSDFTIILLNEAGNIQTWNTGAEKMYGYSSEAIDNKHFSLLYKECLNPSAYLARAVSDGQFKTEEWVRPKNAAEFFAITILTPFYNDQNLLQGFAHTTRNISEKKTLEEENRVWQEQLEEKVLQRTNELEMANKELESFSYSVSHDLRTPLRAISGYSTMLEEDYGERLDAEAKRIIKAIIANSCKMGDLIDDLLSFSRMGKLNVVYDQVSMERLVKESLIELMPAKPHYHITTLPLCTCKGDPNMLKQVWVNLIGNAVKYASKADMPAIEIGCSERGDFYNYYVKDNGAGFDMKYADKLFGVFQRLHRSEEFEGTGLGLALAKRIINKHGGDILGEGNLNSGAIFSFSIPK